MSDIELSAALLGVSEVQRGLSQINDGVRKTSEETKKSGASFREFSKGLRDVYQAMTSVAAVMSLVAKGNPELQRTLEGVTAGMLALGTVLRAFTSVAKLMVGVFGGMLAGFVALGAAAIALAMNWEKVKAIAEKVWSAIGSFLKNIWQGMIQMLEGLGDMFFAVFKIDLSKLIPSWDALSKFLISVWDSLIAYAVGAKDIFLGAFTLDKEQIKKGFSGVTEAAGMLVDAFKPAGEALAEALDSPEMQAAKEKFNAGWKLTADNTVKAWDVIKDAAEKGAKWAIDMLTDAAGKARALAEQNMEYNIKIGEAILKQKLDMLSQYQHVFAAGTDQEIQYRMKVADTSAAMATKEIADMRMVAVTREDQIIGLQHLAERYAAMGEKGKAALFVVTEELKKMTLAVKSNGDILRTEMEKRFEDIRLSGARVAVGIYDAFAASLGSVMTKASSFKDAMKQLWDDIKGIILNTIAKIVASYVWRQLFGDSQGGNGIFGFNLGSVLNSFGGGGGSGGGGGGGFSLGGLFSAAKSGYSAYQAGAATASGGGSFGDAVLSGAGAFLGLGGNAASTTGLSGVTSTWSGGSSLISNPFATEGATAFSAYSANTAAASAELAGAELAGTTTAADASGTFLASLFGIGGSSSAASGNVYGMILGAAAAVMALNAEEKKRKQHKKYQLLIARLNELRGEAATANATNTTAYELAMQGADRSGVSFGQDTMRFARGGDMVVNRPTLMMVGENAPERVTISGASRGSTSNGVAVNFNAPVVLDQITAARFARTLGLAMEAEGRRYG